MEIFEGLMRFSEFIEKQVVLQAEAVAISAEFTSEILEHNVKNVYGDTSKLRDLAQSTQDERVRLGFTANDPLVRTGELRDSVEHEHAGPVATAGSSDPIAAYHEFGFIARGTTVPPRPAFLIGLEETMPEAIAIAAEITHGIATGRRAVSLPPGLPRP